MSERLTRLAERIRQDVAELGHVVERTRGAWQRTFESGDDYYLDSVALNLHGFYSGLERIFELIASVIDLSLPRGVNWHSLLLDQMAAEVRGVRPAVVSMETVAALEEYRGFRHIVRNVYAFRVDQARVETLVAGLPLTFSRLQAELEAFAGFLLKA